MKKLSHADEKGKAVMVDIGTKGIQHRTARARGHIRLSQETLKLVRENQIKKGDVLTVAQLAGISAAKQTQNLIPLCHSILIENAEISFMIHDDGIVAESKVSSTGKTGVEMEALSSVSVALLTIYDMCKAVDKRMIIGGIELIEKIKK
ncbi:MAG: cyclic pyranopterin monophosphate synthase MoaC [Bacteroidales bacterium]|jgi:cyclic pyranopterin phosphate synthase|nr:cyclic pyranopterin monophosphate synthase MoaC [Bacteroidales bacterium]